jgi:hypothetical protein
MDVGTGVDEADLDWAGGKIEGSREKGVDDGVRE